jgi:hypothetical protein
VKNELDRVTTKRVQERRDNPRDSFSFFSNKASWLADTDKKKIKVGRKKTIAIVPNLTSKLE